MYAEANMMYQNNYKNPDLELMKYRDYMTDLTQSPEAAPISGVGGGGGALARYRSAPSSFFASLLEGGGGGGGGGFGDLIGGGDEVAYGVQFPPVVKEEVAEGRRGSGGEREFSVSDEVAAEGRRGGEREYSVFDERGNNQVQRKMSGLARQSSSPAGFFNTLTVDNGFSVINGVGNFKSANGINEKSTPSRRLNDHINFSFVQPSSSRFMPQIAENLNESSKPENEHLGNGNNSNNFYIPSFENDSWNESNLSDLKRSRENEDKFSGFTAMDSQRGDDTNYPNRLTHHMSLPKTSGEMAAIEKYLQFQQDTVPCKIRAKRGFATHPRSIAERVRRTRISDRMKKLQDLFPNMDKQTNTAEMLDLAVEHIKDLQTQVQTLTGKKAKCTCSK